MVDLKFKYFCNTRCAKRWFARRLETDMSNHTKACPYGD